MSESNLGQLASHLIRQIDDCLHAQDDGSLRASRDDRNAIDNAVADLREALAATVQAPAEAMRLLAEAWETSAEDLCATAMGTGRDWNEGRAEGLRIAAKDLLAALSAAPAGGATSAEQRGAQKPLSEDAIKTIDFEAWRNLPSDATKWERRMAFARAIEAAHGIGRG